MKKARERTNRILELDALRGLAAMGVVLWHYQAHFSATPLEIVFLPFYRAGFLLVDFFFVLSGFVVARAFWRQPRQSQLRRNITARLARLYPLHLAALLATALLASMIPESASSPHFNLPTNDTKHLLLNLTLLNQSGLQDGWSFNTPSWSISTEFIANIAFLVFIAMGARTKVLAISALAIIFVALATTGHPLLSGSFVLGVIDLNLARCLAGFGVGVLIHLIVSRNGCQARSTYRSATYLCISILSLVAFAWLMILSARHPPISHYLASIAIAAACVTFVPLAPWLPKIFINRGLLSLGDISYSIYLTHYPVQIVFYIMSLHIAVNFHSPLILLLYLLTVIVVSATTYTYIEKPAQRYFVRFSSRRPGCPSLRDA